MHGGDEMCRQRRYNLSPATNCAGVTKCAVTPSALFTFVGKCMGQTSIFILTTNEVIFHINVLATLLAHFVV